MIINFIIYSPNNQEDLLIYLKIINYQYRVVNFKNFLAKMAVKFI